MRLETIFQVELRKPLVILAFLCVAIGLGLVMTSANGLLVLGALIAFDVMLLALIWPEAATLVFMFVLYINLPAVATRFHGVPGVFSSAFSLFLVIPLASYIIFRRQSLVVTPALPWMGAYLVAQLLSAMHSQDVSAAVPWINNFLLEGLVLYLLVSNVIRTPETLRRVVWVLLLAGSLMGALSLYQELTNSYRNNFGGFAQIDKVLDSSNTGRELIRLAGPIGEKNRYAQVMLVLFPLATFRFRAEKSRLLRVLAVGAMLLILSGTLLTYSRGAAVALFGLLVIMVMWRYIRPDQAILVVLAVVVLTAVVAPKFITRLTTIQTVESFYSEGGPEADNAIRGRTTENLAAFFTFLDYPIFGVGPGQFFEQYSQKYANALGIRYLDTTRRAHNLYLEIAADTGVLGLSSFMAILAATLIRLLRIRRYWLHRRPEIANMVTSFFLSVLAYMASGVFLHLAFQRYFWLLIALANVAIYVFQPDPLLARLTETSLPEDSEPEHPLLIPGRALVPSNTRKHTMLRDYELEQ